MTIFEIVADTTRRRILDYLLQRPHLVGELVEKLEISQPGVSKQLRILREAKLVYVAKDAQRRWYKLRPEPLQEIDHWLAGYKLLLSERYDNLDEYLRALQAQENNDDHE
ncbi:MAG: metalloregulator ArsR/SmtB family transcription factor [Candidatus Promineifilaceae bacterium]|nr:metalloregulator ArsR/SmtB family transcription factor [Candidatus Promineifilaceae bacterium]